MDTKKDSSNRELLENAPKQMEAILNSKKRIEQRLRIQKAKADVENFSKMRNTTSSTLATTSPSKTDQTPISSTSRLSTQANPKVTFSTSLITTDNASDEEHIQCGCSWYDDGAKASSIAEEGSFSCRFESI